MAQSNLNINEADDLKHQIDRILLDYSNEIDEIRIKLNEVRNKPAERTECTFDHNVTNEEEIDQQLKKATIRNKTFIKDLEESAAKLRTRSSYFLADDVLERAKIKYIQYLRTSNRMVEQ